MVSATCRAGIAVFIFFLLLAPAHAADVTKNKQVVDNFYRDVFAARNADAAKSYLRPDYIQHNPHVASGADGFIAFFSKIWAKPATPDYQVKVLKLVAEGDLVVAQVRWTYDSADGKKISSEAFDMFRLQDGKLAEHWDAIDGL
jgi:predicted SnoaL-like aldol condensation-catalyzing enzyme